MRWYIFLFAFVFLLSACDSSSLTGNVAAVPVQPECSVDLPALSCESFSLDASSDTVFFELRNIGDPLFFNQLEYYSDDVGKFLWCGTSSEGIGESIVTNQFKQFSCTLPAGMLKAGDDYAVRLRFKYNDGLTLQMMQQQYFAGKIAGIAE